MSQSIWGYGLKRAILVVSILVTLVVGFQNCGQGYRADVSDFLTSSGGGASSPVRVVKVTASNVVSVQSNKVLIFGDFEDSRVSAVFNDRIRELLSSLKGKYVQVGLVLNSNDIKYTSYQYFAPINGEVELSLANLPPLAPIAIDGSNSGNTGTTGAQLIPYLNKNIYRQRFATSALDAVLFITPETTDDELNLMADKLKSAVQVPTSSGRNRAICTIARYIGDQMPSAFLRESDEFSILAFNARNDGSQINADCIRREDWIVTPHRSRVIQGVEPMIVVTYRPQNDPTPKYYYVYNPNNFQIGGGLCSGADLSLATSVLPPGAVLDKCEYVKSTRSLVPKEITDKDINYCVTPFIHNGMSYLNAVDYYRKNNPTVTILDSCELMPFVYEYATAVQDPAKFGKQYHVTHATALQNGDAVLGLAEMLKERYQVIPKISAISHVSGQTGCTGSVTAGQYDTKFDRLRMLVGESVSVTSVCGAGYSDAFAKTAAVNGGTQGTATFPLNRLGNEIVSKVVIQGADWSEEVPAHQFMVHSDGTMTLYHAKLQDNDKIEITLKPLN